MIVLVINLKPFSSTLLHSMHSINNDLLVGNEVEFVMDVELDYLHRLLAFNSCRRKTDIAFY